MSTAEATTENATCRPAVFPYFHERESWPPGTLAGIYRKLKDQDILPDLIHERGISEEEFLAQLSPHALPSTRPVPHSPSPLNGQMPAHGPELLPLLVRLHHRDVSQVLDALAPK